ncbi:type IV secretion system DNA-binding domain-containing protein [Micromonospora aurantiaca (nom. illeg.)]|uniref:type IV secretion system DNA-binding domain-containing protein n=1 Tax=Micromonospora aurantiaca (nom. illeg.) TaxID=47850 RepID=UPI0033E78476
MRGCVEQAAMACRAGGPLPPAGGGDLVPQWCRDAARWVVVWWSTHWLATLLVAGVVLVVSAVVWQALLRRGLRERVTVELVPDAAFDPSADQVRYVSAQLARARRAVSVLPRSSAAVRVTLAAEGDGLLRYRMSVPRYAEAVLLSAGLPGVSPVEPGFTDPGPPRFQPVEGTEGGSAPRTRRRRIVRAEVTLARRDVYPLAERGLDPDPLDAFARAMSTVRAESGDRAYLHLDLCPVTHARESLWRRLAVRNVEGEQLRRDAAADARSRRSGLAGWAGGPGAFMPGDGSTRSRRVGILAAEMRLQTKSVGGKVFATGEPLWRVQVLIRAESPSKARARAHLHAVLAALEQFAGENYWRVVGVNVAGGFFDGADAWWRRAWFDYRWRTGLFRPRRTRRVRSSEVIGLLKPPTIRCGCEATSRMPALPAPPDQMPTYRSPSETPDLMPQGFARAAAGWRPVGTPLADSLFSVNFGRAEYGKSERAIVQAVHLANAGNGLLFLDPHADALDRMRPYLGAAADRIVEINLSSGGAAQAGWNPLNMADRRPGDIEHKVAAVVNSFASAMSWGQVNNRAMTLTQMAAQSLCELGLQMPRHLQPTIFQMTTILADEDWRAGVMPYLTPHTRDFWETRFDRLSRDAITPITNLLDRLRASDRVAALFGSPTSSYDVRAAMDAGQVVLACPAGIGDKDRLVTAFFLYDVLRAALSRRDLPPDRRRPFWLFADEIQQYAVRDLSRMLEETRKFGLRVAAATQSVERLPDYLRESLMTNRSHLITTASSADSARTLAKEWGGLVRPEQITGLDRYTALGSFRLHGKSTPPFFLHGFEVSDIFHDLRDDAAPARIAEAVDANLARRPIRDTLADLETLDERIAAWLLARRSGPPTDPPTQPTPPSVDPDPGATVVPIRRRPTRGRGTRFA